MEKCGVTVSQVKEMINIVVWAEFKTELPNLEKTIGKVVSIPVGWWVTEDERKHIVESIKNWKK